MGLTEREELELLELEARDKAFPVASTTQAVAEPVKENKEFGMPARIAAETAGAIGGEILGAKVGALAGPAGVIPGAWVGGAYGAGAATFGMDVAEGKSKMEALGSAGASAATQLVAPAIVRKTAIPAMKWISKSLGKVMAKVFGGASNVGQDTVSQLLIKEARVGGPTGAERVWQRIGKITEYDVKNLKAKINLDDPVMRETLEAENPVEYLDTMWHDSVNGRNLIYDQVNKANKHLVRRGEMTPILKGTNPKNLTEAQSLRLEEYFDPIEAYFVDKAALKLTPLMRSQTGQTILAELGAGALMVSGLGVGPLGLLGIGAVSPRVGGVAITGTKMAADAAGKLIEKTPPIVEAVGERAAYSTIDQGIKE